MGVYSRVGVVSLHISGAPQPRPAREWVPPLLGFVAAIVVTAALIPSRMPPLDWLRLWLMAGRFTIPVFAVTTIVVWSVVLLTSRRSNYEVALDAGAAATWLPPCAIFFWMRSPWAALAAAILSITAARCLLARREPRQPVQTGLPRAIFAALLLEAAVLAGSSHAPRAAAGLTCVAFALLTWMLTCTGVWAPAGKRLGRIRVVPALFFSLTFSAGAITPFLQHGSGDGGPYAGDGASKIAADSWPGVILWSDVHRQIVIAPPPVPQSSRKWSVSAQQNRTEIPFSGAYYFYRGRVQPPNAYVTHGDATLNSFRSTDERPLRMEARQNLGTLVDLSTCSEIRLYVRNRDRNPDAVRVELVVQNRTQPGKPSQSLGSVALDFREGAGVLRFPVPAHLPLRQFDELTVIFHLMPPRADHSARIAIDRFALIPRSV